MVRIDRVEKHNISCNLCGSHKYDVIFEDELGDSIPPLDHDFSPTTRLTYRIVRCNNCRLVYTNPMPRISSFYSDTVDEVYIASEIQRKKTAEVVIQDILKHKPDGHLLDIGCSTGIFLDVACDNFTVEGIETSLWAQNIASKKHVVHKVPLSELELPNVFDVVTMFGVIEHFEDPRAEIMRIHKSLKQGGLLVIYTGDVDSLMARLLGKRWWWYQGMHTYYFSKATCAQLLSDCGFTVVQVKNHAIYFKLFSLAISMRRYWIGKLLSPLLNLPLVKNLMLPLSLSGEMLMFAFKK